MEQLIEMVTDRQFQIGVLAALGAAAAVFTVLQPMFETDPMKNRVKRVAEYKENLRKEHRESISQKTKVGVGGLRNRQAKGMGREIVEQFKLLEVFDAQSAAKKLAMAGMRGEKPVYTFMFARLVTPIIACFAMGIYVYIFNGFELGSFGRLMATFGALILGFFLPNIYISNIITKRQQSIELNFPDAMDLLLICVESGMSIEAALQKVSEEVGANSPELAEELGLTTAELSYLADRKEAYVHLGERTGLEGVKAVTTALIQSEVYGTPVGASLRVMAAENRELRMQAAEKKAAALPPKLTVPMILFNLPVLFLVILGPAMLRVFGMAE